MNRSEYQQRQRKDCAAAHALGGDSCDDEDVSSLGLSLGSVQSAPALGGLGLGLHSGGSGGGGGRGRGRRRGHKRTPRADTAGAVVSDRGNSFTAFDNVNPLEGGIRVSTSPLSLREAELDHNRLEGGGRGLRRGGGGGGGAGRGRRGGALSPLSTSVRGDSSVGPESVGGLEENADEDADPHLSLLKVFSTTVPYKLPQCSSTLVTEIKQP